MQTGISAIDTMNSIARGGQKYLQLVYFTMILLPRFVINCEAEADKLKDDHEDNLAIVFAAMGVNIRRQLVSLNKILKRMSKIFEGLDRVASVSHGQQSCLW